MSGTRRRAAPAWGGRDTTPAACVRWLVEEACNNGNLAALDAVLALPNPPGPAADVGARPTLRDTLADFRDAVPDARWTILELVAEGEAVVARLKVQGTFSGPLLGLAPPGRPATVTGVAICRFAEGCLVDLWLQADLLGLLMQLGVLPRLDLARVVAMARVARAGARLAP
ncbi:MAG TPA: ester cyclase [Thermomicrobiaceae bacterium]|nr:ester cyclase [Thermomicrobiaceae bacterium]